MGPDDRTAAGDPAYQRQKPMADGDAFFDAETLSPREARSRLLARNWWAVALRGLVALVFGAAALLLPGVTIASLVLLFALYMLLDGVLAIASAIRAARRHERWHSFILEGVADLIAGAIALVAPAITVLAFMWLSGAWAVVSGALMLAAAMRLHATHGRWIVALAGAVSVLWGVLLLMQPVVGAVVLTWWLGAYALIFGIALLGAAWRLRRLRHGGALSHAS
jgi:uncharacterized membrane protein HdeD (DUF308 family)